MFYYLEYQTVEEITVRFNRSYRDGFVYVAAFSFCSPSSIHMVSHDVLHAISASDAAHGFLGRVPNANEHDVSERESRACHDHGLCTQREQRILAHAL